MLVKRGLGVPEVQRALHFSRIRGAEQWLLWSTDDMNDTLGIPSIGCELRLSDIYARVDFGEDE